MVVDHFPRIQATCAEIGIEFDPWQVDLNTGIFGKAASGLYAADTVVISIARQVGKTFDVGAVVIGDSIATPGTTTVWTAHQFKVARESFNELKSLAQMPQMLPHVDPRAITSAAGNETIPFRNGSRIVFAARERGAIRGFTKVRRIVLDEGQILTEKALADLAPTQNQARNPQIIIMGTPPKPTDPSEVFTRLRDEAINGVSEGVLYVELSADRGCDPNDQAQWRKANPSFPARTPEKAILRLQKLLSPEDFLREVLGIWDLDGGNGLIKWEKWVKLLDEGSEMSEIGGYNAAVGLDVGDSWEWAAVSVAGLRADDRIHLEVGRYDRGTAWVVPFCEQLAAKHPGISFVADKNSPTISLAPDLEEAGIQVRWMDQTETRQACGMFMEALDEGTLRHRGQGELDKSVKHVVARPAGDGGFTFGRRASSIDISPLNANCWAHWHTVLFGPVDIEAQFG